MTTTIDMMGPPMKTTTYEEGTSIHTTVTVQGFRSTQILTIIILTTDTTFLSQEITDPYNNDIYERSASSKSYYNYNYHPTPSPYYNKRIVYYAHLPEIVRSPVTRYDQPNRHSAYSVENNKTANASSFGRDKKNFPSSVKN